MLSNCKKNIINGCVLLLLLPLYKYKSKLMCNVNRRRRIGIQRNVKKKIVRPMKMLLQEQQS
jgi:hypothetical protein